MYVLADLEWVENNNKIFFSQLALTRVDENWQAVDSFYSRFQPKDYTFQKWGHVGFTGGTPQEFMSAPVSNEVFTQVYQWLRPDDILVWWNSGGKEWIHKLVPAMCNRSVVLNDYFPHFLGADGRGSPYTVGNNLGLEVPGERHYSPNDVEMVRRTLEASRFPNPIPPLSVLFADVTSAGIKNMNYIVHLDSGIVHSRGCPHIPETGRLKGYNDLRKAVSKEYKPCACVRSEYSSARRARNQDIIDRTEYSFLYSPDSQVFHRRGCQIMLGVKKIQGTIRYKSCVATGRQPCKRCNPAREHETMLHVSAQTKQIKQQKTLEKGCLSQAEQKAVNRHRQAIEQRKAIEANTALSQQEKNALYTLSQPGYAFFASQGYRSFHLRNCKKLAGLQNIKGFARYQDATKAGYHACKCCKPSRKHDVTISLPIYSKTREGESVNYLRSLCRVDRFFFWEEEDLFYIETNAGIWRLKAKTTAPYRLEHVNLISTPNNRTEFHKQPRLFLSLKDAFYYIKRHDEGMNFTWKGTEYTPTEIAL